MLSLNNFLIHLILNIVRYLKLELEFRSSEVYLNEMQIKLSFI